MRQSNVSFMSAIALVAAIGAVSAQTPAPTAGPTVTRTVLQKADISVPGREAVTAKAEIPVGGTTGRHTHPGEEISYVLDGTLLLDVTGQPSRTLKAGDVFLIPAGTVHNATNKSTAGATVIANYIVEKGKPLTTPAP